MQLMLEESNDFTPYNRWWFNTQTATINSYQYSKKDELTHIEQDYDAHVNHRYDAIGNVEFT